MGSFDFFFSVPQRIKIIIILQVIVIFCFIIILRFFSVSFCLKLASDQLFVLNRIHWITLPSSQ